MRRGGSFSPLSLVGASRTPAPALPLIIRDIPMLQDTPPRATFHSRNWRVPSAVLLEESTLLSLARMPHSFFTPVFSADRVWVKASQWILPDMLSSRA